MLNGSNKENIKGTKCLYQSIELKPQNQFQEQEQCMNNSNSDQKVFSMDQNPQDIKKQNSFASLDGNSRRFSLFSKTSFATQSSFMFGTRFLNKSLKSVPKVNINNIIKQKAYLYLDEDLALNFDDLLDKGYELVANKKDERDILKEYVVLQKKNQNQEAQMREEINNLEKEIVPLLNSISQQKDALNQQDSLVQKYQNEIKHQVNDIEELKNKIHGRLDEVQNTHYDLTNNIKTLEIKNNDISSKMNIQKANHHQEINQFQKLFKVKQQEIDQLIKILNDRKKDFDDKKMSQAERLRKMGNKSKMFIGILKH